MTLRIRLDTENGPVTLTVPEIVSWELEDDHTTLTLNRAWYVGTDDRRLTMLRISERYTGVTEVEDVSDERWPARQRPRHGPLRLTLAWTVPGTDALH